MIKFALMSFVTYNSHICYQMVNDPLGNQHCHSNATKPEYNCGSNRNDR